MKESRSAKIARKGFRVANALFKLLLAGSVVALLLDTLRTRRDRAQASASRLSSIPEVVERTSVRRLRMRLAHDAGGLRHARGLGCRPDRTAASAGSGWRDPL